MFPQPNLDRMNELALAVRTRYRAVQDSVAHYTGTTRPAWDKSIEVLGARGATAKFISDTITNSTESIITAVRVFKDGESSPQEQAASVLRVMSSFAMLAALAGPEGMIASTIVTALLGLITIILDATAPDRESEMAKLERLLRLLNAEAEANEVKAAQALINRCLHTVRSFNNDSKSWEDILQTAPITSDASHFHLAKTSAWLLNPNNKSVATWEEVFLGYANTVIQDLALQLTMLTKLKPNAADRAPMNAYMQAYGADMEQDFGALMDIVEKCGDYYHVGNNFFGYHWRNPWQPKKAGEGWIDMDIHRVLSIAISPRNGRIWSIADGDVRELITGKSNQMSGLKNYGAGGCFDLCLVPWSEQDTDLMLLTQKPFPNVLPRLIVNEWKERRSEFFTAQELSDRPGLGFSQEWWAPQLPASTLMARAFHRAGESQGYVYLVQQTPPENRFSLCCVRLGELKRSFRQRVEPQPLTLPMGYDTNIGFRITIAGTYLYLYCRRTMWRVNHDDLLNGQGAWQMVQPPSGRLTNPDANLNPNWPDLSGWWSNGWNDVYAWSEDHVVAVLGDTGELWTGNFIPPKPIWQDFQVTWIDNGLIPEQGRSGIFITVVQEQHKPGLDWNIRVFDASGKIVADTRASKLNGRRALSRLEVQLTNDIRRGQRQPNDKESRDLAATVAELLGATWEWQQLFGNAKRAMKVKHASFDLCARLYENGASLRAGRTAQAQVAGA